MSSGLANQTNPLPVPIALSDPAQPLIIAVMVDPTSSRPVVLRELIDGQVLLGCLLDAGGRMHRQLEIWVQRASSLLKAAHLSRDVLQNGKLDEKWQALSDAWAALGGEDVIITGWEHDPDRILQLDLAMMCANDAISSSGSTLKLCRDEALLKSAGLPSYDGALHRYLTDGEKFVAATPDAPVPADEFATTITSDPKKPLLNPEGGPILVRSLHAVGLSAYSDYLGGASRELSIGHSHPPNPLLDAAMERDEQNSSWVLGSYGRTGRLIEVLYLKLAMLLDAFRAVRNLTEQLNRPLLNLSADAFRVNVASAGAALPSRWGARAVLSAASEAIPLNVPGAQGASFIAARSDVEGSYRAPVMRAGVSGTGLLRVRRVTPARAGHYILEGTLVAPAIAQASNSDLVWMRLSIGGITCDLWGTAETGGASGPGEFRFRSFEQPGTDQEIETLKRGEGWSAPDVSFSMTPGLSSPCDLYALAAVAARVLLVNGERQLAVTMDELISLANVPRMKEAATTATSAPIDQVIERMFQKDVGMMQMLGPQNVMNDPKSYVLSAEAIPVALWSRVLGFIVRCFPGAVPESFADNTGDAPPGALHRVFDPAIEELSVLVESARNLIFMDWFSTNEIAQVIARRAEAAGRLLANAAPSSSSSSSSSKSASPVRSRPPGPSSTPSHSPDDSAKVSPAGSLSERSR